MKKLILFLFLSISLSMFAQDNIFLPKNILMYDEVYPEEFILGYTWHGVLPRITKQNLELKLIDGTTIQDIIVNKTLSGDIDVYEYRDINDVLNNKIDSVLNIENVNARLGYSIDTIPDWEIEEGYTVSENKINPKELKAFSFYEEWGFDVKNLTFSKNVKYWLPIRVFNYKNMGIQFPESCFMIKNQKSKKDKMIPFAKVVTEFLIHGRPYYYSKFMNSDTVECSFEILFEDKIQLIEKHNCPFWNSYNKDQLANYLLDASIVKDNAYSYENPEQKLNSQEIVDIIEPKRNESFYIFSDDGDILRDTSIQITEALTAYDIVSYIFYEEWFINPTTLYIEKKITGICPVVLGNNIYDGKYIFKPLYILKLNSHEN
ncbi:MAG: hypothetical protein K9J13_14345 [Saprospiraceae bacterium]|nr:hypothetical protein [Saprospiraceae bacterium]